MDRRQQKTRAAVYKAFTDLLRTTPYSSITIQDIIDKANIGRSTFYAHFQTKEDLLVVLCTEIFDHVFSAHLSKEGSHNFSSETGLVPELTHIMYHFKDDSEYISGILQNESGEIFMRYFKEHLKEMFEKEFSDPPEGIPYDYFINHLVCGYADTVKWWMDSDATPEEATLFFKKLYLS